jgi:carboxypeptidase PM20D1
MKRTFILIFLAIVIPGIIIVLRTIMHTPTELRKVESVEIELNEMLVAEHLSEAIRFPTVSHQDPADREQQAFENFIQWVSRTYPELQAKLSLQRLNDTLLYKWQGSDAALKPILSRWAG